MGRTACKEPQCLYKGALYLYLLSLLHVSATLVTILKVVSYKLLVSSPYRIILMHHHGLIKVRFNYTAIYYFST